MKKRKPHKIDSSKLWIVNNLSGYDVLVMFTRAIRRAELAKDRLIASCNGNPQLETEQWVGLGRNGESYPKELKAYPELEKEDYPDEEDDDQDWYEDIQDT